MDMRHGGLVLRDTKSYSGDFEFIAGKKRVGHAMGDRLPHGMSDHPHVETSQPPQAVRVLCAGSEGANGIYRATTRQMCGAHVFEHTVSGTAFKIARSATKSSKTGQVKHGWLLSSGDAPLYGAPTESKVVPSSGWKAFGGVLPVPEMKVYGLLAEAAFDFADSAFCAGVAALDRKDWLVAYEAFTSGLDALERSGSRFGDPFESRAALLLSQRARALVRLDQGRSALRDVIAALELAPGLQVAEVAVFEAAMAIGLDNACTRNLLKVAGKGRILDQGAPLSLHVVEHWIEEFAKTAGRRDPVAPSTDYRRSIDMWTDRNCAINVFVCTTK